MCCFSTGHSKLLPEVLRSNFDEQMSILVIKKLTGLLDMCDCTNIAATVWQFVYAHHRNR